ncbi:hypothetical protein [Candidatus Thioglobus sp.]
MPFASIATPNIADGALLYEESCAKCHHAPYQSLGWEEMSNKIELSHMIKACSNHFQLEWNQQDIKDTTEYLNAEFFFFDK